MKLTDLMYGDEVRVIWEEGCEQNYTMRMDEHAFMDVEEGRIKIEPIVLTENILKDSGFEMTLGRGFKLGKNEFGNEIVLSYSAPFDSTGHGPRYTLTVKEFNPVHESSILLGHCNYVHELQNAIAVFGIQLKAGQNIFVRQ